MRSTAWDQESNVIEFPKIRRRGTKKMPINSIRVFKRLGNHNFQSPDKDVFIVRSKEAKLEAGQIHWNKATHEVCYHSTIQNYSMQSLCDILGFMSSLHADNVDLILREGNEVQL